MPRITITTTAAAAAVLAAQATANASLSLALIDTGSGSTIRLLHPELQAGQTNIFAGQLRHQVTDAEPGSPFLTGQLTTFASEFLRDPSPTPTTYTPLPLAELPEGPPPADPIAQPKADAINALFTLHYAEASDPDTINRKSAAFQLLIWEIVEDYDPANLDSLDLNTGTLTATKANGDPLSNAFINDFNNYRDSLADLLNINPPLPAAAIALAGQTAQSQIAFIPTAPTLALATIAALTASRRRR